MFALHWPVILVECLRGMHLRALANVTFVGGVVRDAGTGCKHIRHGGYGTSEGKRRLHRVLGCSTSEDVQ